MCGKCPRAGREESQRQQRCSSSRTARPRTVHLDDGVVDLDTGCIACVPSGCMRALEPAAGRHGGREIARQERQQKGKSACSVVALSSVQVRPAARTVALSRHCSSDLTESLVCGCQVGGCVCVCACACRCDEAFRAVGCCCSSDERCCCGLEHGQGREEASVPCSYAVYRYSVRVLCGEKRRGWWEEPKAGTRKCREGNQEKRNHAVSPDASSTQAHKANGDVRSSQLISMDSRCQQQRPLFPVYAALHQNLY